MPSIMSLKGLIAPIKWHLNIGNSQVLLPTLITTKTSPQNEAFQVRWRTQIVYSNQYVRARWTLVTNLVH
jgi:hypothetical protein